MATIDDLINKVSLASSGLQTQVENNLLITANDAADTIVQRLKTKGQDAKGKAFYDYSPGYKKQKIKAGRYSGHVDFTNTNTMLRSLSVRGKNAGNGKVTVTVAVADREKIKLDANEKLRGRIIELAQKEEKALEKDFNKRNDNYFKNIFRT
jgi:cell division protein YceG involved in septum cleavage